MMRIKKPDLVRPFKIPFNIKIKGKELPITSLFGCLATLTVWMLVVITKPDGRYLGIGWLILGLIMYFLYRKKQNIGLTAQVEIEKIKMPDFKIIEYKKILVSTRGGWLTETVQVACELAKLHKAEITAVHVMEIALSISMTAPMILRSMSAQAVLKSAEAISRELGVPIKLQLVRARSTAKAIIEMIEEENFDLLVLGSVFGNSNYNQKNLDSFIEEITQNSACRVIIACGNEEISHKLDHKKMSSQVNK